MSKNCFRRRGNLSRKLINLRSEKDWPKVCPIMFNFRTLKKVLRKRMKKEESEKT